MRGMATLSQDNQELLVVRDKVGRPPGKLGVSKSMECDIFPFSALTLLVGRQERHPACKKLGVSLLVVVIWLELCTIYSSSCHHHFHHPFAPCGLRGCKNWLAPFPGRMSYKATKPGLALSVVYLSMFIVLLFIRAPLYVLLVLVGMCPVFWLFCLSCHYLRSVRALNVYLL